MGRLGSRVLGLSTLVTVAVFACASEDTRYECGVNSSALFGSDAGAVPQLADAVGGAWFGLADQDYHEFALCTFTQIAPHWMLTAAHCLPVGSPLVVYTSFAPEFSNRRLVSQGSTCSSPPNAPQRVLRQEVHPKLDLMLLEMSQPALETLPISERPAVLGEEVLMIGYGLQETSQIGIRESLKARVTDFKDEWLEVRAAGEGGACVGDSGGPLLRQGPNGGYEVVGVLSLGGASCFSYDLYVDVQLARSWIEGVLSE